MENVFETSEIAVKLANYKLPEFDELIKIDIFMNQLVQILNEYLAPFATPDEPKALTPSMINNYVFNHIIEPPINKKYNRTHIVHLLIIGIMKQVLPINIIGKVLELQVKEYPIDVAYKYFCAELENALKVVFEVRNFAKIEDFQPNKVTPLTKTARSAILAFVNQVYVKQRVYYASK